VVHRVLCQPVAVQNGRPVASRWIRAHSNRRYDWSGVREFRWMPISGGHRLPCPPSCGSNRGIGFGFCFVDYREVDHREIAPKEARFNSPGHSGDSRAALGSRTQIVPRALKGRHERFANRPGAPIPVHQSQCTNPRQPLFRPDRAEGIARDGNPGGRFAAIAAALCPGLLNLAPSGLFR
jgi:hypothetical protein